MIQPHNWQMISHVIPEEFKQLVGSCFEYEEEMAYLDTGNPITGRDISTIQILINKIMSEYMKVIQMREKDEKIIEDIRSDMKTTLSNWFDTKGQIKDLSANFLLSMQKGNLDFHLPLFATPSTGFIHARIFQSLVEAYNYSSTRQFFKIEDLSHFIGDKDWTKLGRETYPSLCSACHQFEAYLEHLLEIDPYVNKNIIAPLYDKMIIVLEEYMKIVGNQDKVTQEVVSKDSAVLDFVMFVNAIYVYLLKTHEKREQAFINQFIISSKYKAGIFPEVVRDGKGGDFGIKLPPSQKGGGE